MQVKADKENEVKNGHDGTWVAHPALVPIAKGIFDAGMKSANQLSIARSDVNVTAADLLAVPEVCNMPASAMLMPGLSWQCTVCVCALIPLQVCFTGIALYVDSVHGFLFVPT